MRPAVDLDRARALVESGAITRERACTRKVAYDTRNEARHGAKRVFVKTGRNTGTYKCIFCTKYHITKEKHGAEWATS